MINFVCGLISGILTGFGVGGGLILIMLLTWLGGFSQLEVQTINLIYYIPTAIFSVWVYSKEKSVSYKVGVKFLSIGIIAAIIGAIVANNIDVNMLRKLFSIYLIIIGGYFLFFKNKG